MVDPSLHLQLPHIAPNHIESNSGRLLSYTNVAEDGVTSAKHHFASGHVLYSKIRPYLAKVALVDFEGLCSADMYPLETDLEPRFLKWWMLTPEFTRLASGEQARTVLPKINKRGLAALPVPVPPLAEQRRIVDLLEEHLSHLDAAERGLQAARQRLTAMERGALDTYFSGAEVELGGLIDSISAGKSFGAANAPARDDEWGIIKVSAMTWGSFEASENKAVSGVRIDPSYEINEGDLLVSRANTEDYVGASVLVGAVRPRLLLSDKSMRLTPKKGIRTEWLWRALQAPSARRQISRLSTGTKDSMRNVSQSALKRVRLRQVDAAAQSAALESFAVVSASAAALRASIVDGEARLSLLRRSLLDAAFSGRLTSSTDRLSEASDIVDA